VFVVPLVDQVGPPVWPSGGDGARHAFVSGGVDLYVLRANELVG